MPKKITDPDYQEMMGLLGMGAPAVSQFASMPTTGPNPQATPAAIAQAIARGAGYQRLTNGQILTRPQLEEMVSYMKSKTGGGDWTVDQLFDKYSGGSGNGAKPAGWNRGMTDEEVAALGGPDMGTFFDVAGDQYQTPEGGFGNGYGDAGYHYGITRNPDGTYTVGDPKAAGTPSGDYSGSFRAQQADRRSTFNLGEFGVKAGLLSALAMTAPGLANAFGGGTVGGALGGAVGGMGSAIATDSDIGRGALFGGLAGGLNGFASGLDNAAVASSTEGLDAVNAFDNGSMQRALDSVGNNALQNALPSTGQLVKAGGNAVIGSLAGQDPLQALTGAGLNLTGITGSNALQDLGIDPKLSNILSGAGVGLLSGRDPSSVALGALPALGGYAGSQLGGLFGSQQPESTNPAEWTPDNSQWLQDLPGQIESQGIPQGESNFDFGDTSWLDSLIQETPSFSNTAPDFSSPMLGGDVPDNTGANNMPTWTLPPPGNNPDEWGGGYDYESLLNSLPPINIEDFLPADLGNLAPSGNLPGTDVSWQSVLDQLPGIGQNAVTPGSIGGYGNTANANSGSGLSGIIGNLLGTGAAGAIGSAGGALGGGLTAAALGALLGSVNGSKQSGTSTSTTVPWGPQQPYLLDLFEKAKAAQAGATGMSPLQTNAINQAGSSNAMQGQSNGVVSDFLNKDPATTFGIGLQNNYQGQTTTPVSNAYLGAQTGMAPAYQSNSPGQNSWGNQTTTPTTANQSAQVGANPYLGSTTNPITSQNAQFYGSQGRGQNAYQGNTVTPIGSYRADLNQSQNVGANPYEGATTQATSNPYLGQQTSVGTNAYLGMNNPYLQTAIDYANKDTERAMSGQINRANRQSGSFGNSGVAEEYGRQLADQYGRNSNAARMADYSAQMGLSENDVNRRLSAQQTDLSRNSSLAQNQGQFNAGLQQADIGRNAGLAQQGLQNTLQNNQFNANAGNQNNQFNASLGFNTGQANAGLQAQDLARNAGLSENYLNAFQSNNQYNAGAQNQNAQFNSNLGFGTSQANAGLQAQDLARNAGLAQTGLNNNQQNNQFNAGVLNNTGQFNAGLQQNDFTRNAGIEQNWLNNLLNNNQYNTGALNQNSQFNAGLAQNDLSRNAALASSLGFGNAGLQQNDLARNSGLSESAMNRDIGQFNTAQSNQLNAAFNSPQMANQWLQNLTGQYNLGSTAQNQPFDALKNYQQLISGGYGSSTSTPNYTNPIAGLLGGAATGASIYNSIFNPRPAGT